MKPSPAAWGFSPHRPLTTDSLGFWSCPSQHFAGAAAPGDAAGTTLNYSASIVPHRVQEEQAGALWPLTEGYAAFCIPDLVLLLLRQCGMWTEQHEANSSLCCSGLSLSLLLVAFTVFYTGLLLPYTHRAWKKGQKEVKEPNKGRITAVIGHCRTTNYNIKVEKQSYCKESCERLRTEII